MMPSEPDKKMEDLLRTYARKRREDAGEPPVLHPATRRLLQAEAAKLRPREEAPKRTSWLLLHWPRVAFAVGVFALLSFAVWNAIPDRGRSPSHALFAKQDMQEKAPEKAAAQPSAPSRDEAAAPAAAAPKSQLRENFELDKDLANRPQPAPISPPERSLDEFRSAESLRAAGAPTDVRLKKESADRQLRLQQAPDDGVMLAEKETVNGPAENQVLVRKLAPATSGTRLAVAPEASPPPITGAPKSGVNLSVTPSADAKAKQVGISYSAPTEPIIGGSSGRVPTITQATTLTNSYPFDGFNGGQGLGAERQRQPTPLSRTSPTPGAPSILGFDTQSGTPKGGRADFGTEKRTDTGTVTLADYAQTRARTAIASASRPPVTTDTTQAQALAKQYYRFRRQTDPDQPSEAKVLKGSAPPSVMLTFDVAQDGDRVLVTDSDGSVYAGHFLTATESGQKRFGEVAEEPNRPAPTGSAAQRLASASRRYSNAIVTVPMTTNRLFRVNGTNRTYGQLVTIEALLAGGPNASTAASQWRGVGGATAPPSPRPAPEPYSKGLATKPAGPPVAANELQEAQRLVGKMRIGTSEEVNLIAVPVAK